MAVVVVADPRAHDVGLVPRRPPRPRAPRSGRPSAGFSASGRRASRSATGRAAARASVEVSRSPKTVIATVRGIGVAVMTSTCGRLAALARAARPAARRRTGAARRRRRARGRRTDTCSWRRAWVPTTMPGLAARPRRAGPGDARRCAGCPVSSTTRGADARRRRACRPAARSPSIARDRPVVLGGQHLGGGEQRGLAAGVDDRRASPAARRRSCPSRPRPAAAGASGARGARSLRRLSPTVDAGPRSARTAAARRRPRAGRPGAAAAACASSGVGRARGAGRGRPAATKASSYAQPALRRRRVVGGPRAVDQLGGRRQADEAAAPRARRRGAGRGRRRRCRARSARACAMTAASRACPSAR